MHASVFAHPIGSCLTNEVPTRHVWTAWRSVCQRTVNPQDREYVLTQTHAHTCMRKDTHAKAPRPEVSQTQTCSMRTRTACHLLSFQNMCTHARARAHATHARRARACTRTYGLLLALVHFLQFCLSLHLFAAACACLFESCAHVHTHVRECSLWTYVRACMCANAYACSA